jgi:hypothetical protein
MNEQQYQEYLRKIQAGEQVTPEERQMAMAFMLGPNPFQPKTGGLMDQFTPGPDFIPQQTDEERYKAYIQQAKAGTSSQEDFEWAKEYRNKKMSEGTGSLLTYNGGVLDTVPELNTTAPDVGDTLNMLGYKPNQQAPSPPPNPWDINNIPLIYPGGTDLSTELYSLGRGLGMEKGTKGRGAMIAGGAGAAILGGTRDVLSGLGYEKQQNLVRDWYRARQQDNTYNSISQTGNTNTVGGIPIKKYGGEFKSYEDGGEMMQQQMAPEQQEMLQQVQMFVVEMMQQGAQPEQVVQELVQNGVPQEQAVMLVEQVMMQMQQQQVPQEMVPQQAIPQEQPMQPQVGQEVSFKYGGKKVSGKIKKIENGKIYL